MSGNQHVLGVEIEESNVLVTFLVYDGLIDISCNRPEL
jgi:hypothetical protein